MQNNKRPDYPIKFYVIRLVNIFCFLIFNFLMFLKAAYVAWYFFLIFYVWLLITISIIEIGYVIRGDKVLFNTYKKTNVFFLIIYSLSIFSVFYHYVIGVFF